MHIHAISEQLAVICIAIGKSILAEISEDLEGPYNALRALSQIVQCFCYVRALLDVKRLALTPHSVSHCEYTAQTIAFLIMFIALIRESIFDRKSTCSAVLYWTFVCIILALSNSSRQKSLQSR